MRPPESFVGQPIRSLQTMLCVIAKDRGMLPLIIPDGIYGPSTMQAVSTYQRMNGLPPTGIADQETWEHIVQDYEPAAIRVGKAEPIEILIEPGQVFKENDSGPYIYLAQSMLTQLCSDYACIDPPDHTGIMDPQTIKSITSFQVLSDLPETGELDRLTWKYLANMFTLSAHHHNAVVYKTEL